MTSFNFSTLDEISRHLYVEWKDYEDDEGKGKLGSRACQTLKVFSDIHHDLLNGLKILI